MQCRAVQCSAVQVRQCKTEAGKRYDRLELFTLNCEDGSGEGVALLLAEDSLLEGTGRHLQDTGPCQPVGDHPAGPWSRGWGGQQAAG